MREQIDYKPALTVIYMNLIPYLRDRSNGLELYEAYDEDHGELKTYLDVPVNEGNIQIFRLIKSLKKYGSETIVLMNSVRYEVIDPYILRSMLDQENKHGDTSIDEELM